MLLPRTKILKITLIPTNRIKSSIKGYKTLLSRVKQLKSKSNASKQNQIKCKMIKNTVAKSKTTKK